MNVILVKSKIHQARITHADLEYEGSLEIDSELMREALMKPYEKILVTNASNGERLETYAIPGAAGSRVFRLNGAAAHRGKPGDMVTIMSFGVCSEIEAEGWTPRVIVMDENNEIRKSKGKGGG